MSCSLHGIGGVLRPLPRVISALVTVYAVSCIQLQVVSAFIHNGEHAFLMTDPGVLRCSILRRWSVLLGVVLRRSASRCGIAGCCLSLSLSSCRNVQVISIRCSGRMYTMHVPSALIPLPGNRSALWLHLVVTCPWLVG